MTENQDYFFIFLYHKIYTTENGKSKSVKIHVTAILTQLFFPLFPKFVLLLAAGLEKSEKKIDSFSAKNGY